MPGTAIGWGSEQRADHRPAIDLTLPAAAAAGQLEPSESVAHPSGTVVAGQPDSFAGSIEIVIDEIDDPSLVVPLPWGVMIVGEAYTISATPAVASAPGHPFAVGLSVP